MTYFVRIMPAAETQAETLAQWWRESVRRIAMNKTPYHVYYRVNEKLNEVVIMAVWSAMRKRGPPLATR